MWRRKEKRFFFTQSIYPGQTYKAVINASHGMYTYETKNFVEKNGYVCHDKYFVKIYKNQNSDYSFTEEQVRKIVINKINNIS